MPCQWAVVTALGLLAIAGCSHGGGGNGDAATTTSAYSIVVESAEIDRDEPLPPDVCYVASRRYEVEISGRSRQPHGLCADVAATYLRHEPRRRWPPPYLRDPDKAPSVVCVLARDSERLEIDYGPADSGRIDADAICDRLTGAGWKRRPPSEGLDGPWSDSD